MEIQTSIYIGFILNGLFTGLGAALGTYLAHEHLIENMKKLGSKFKKEETK